MKVFNRPPAWPGFNNQNLTMLADYLYRENLDGKFTMRCNLAVTTNGLTVHPEWTQHPIGHCAALGQSGSHLGLQARDGEPLNTYYSRVLIRPQSFRARWHWCFSPDWEKIDNSAKGCAQRIFVLCHTGLPSNWAEQVLGKEQLSYTNTENLGIIYEEQYSGGHFEFTRPSIEERSKDRANTFPVGEH
jgi:hypothetical protein